MRVKVLGNNNTAIGLCGLLIKAGFQVVEESPIFTVEIEESIEAGDLIVDGVDGELEHTIINNICELIPLGRVVLQRKGGNRDDSKIVLVVPVNDKVIWAAQQGIIRSLIQCTTKGKPDNWWVKLLKH